MNLARVLAWPAGVAFSLSFGCSSPPKPPAQGAVTMTVSQEPGVVCSATHGAISAPGGADEDKAYNELTGCDLRNGCVPDQVYVVDQDQGQSVTCSVDNSGGVFQVSVSLTSNPTSTTPSIIFNASGSLPDTPTASGTFTIGASDTQTHASLLDKNCTVTIAPNTGAVSNGKIWAQFTCPSLAKVNDASGALCGGNGGFIFENCN